MSFTSVLIANRGEIAYRIGRTLRAEGLGWLAVHGPGDAGAPHVAMADAAMALPSYLDITAVIGAAKAMGAGAVHPGYGFLSENPDLARAVMAAGLVWIGPPPEAMALMADKGAAKRAMEAAGVPCLPGHRGEDQSDAALIAAAGGVGYPLMVKAAAGGGGRGMRLVPRPEALPEALTRARSEAEKAFGDGRLILERAVLGARHVEVQVFADAQGGVIHLFERDCSVQRRHQKLIEEAPAPGISPELRARLGAAAVLAARACDYRGAGTVEFLLQGEEFHFLEMNTRLQVEHPVTEAITGLDLVALQLDVARGGALPPQEAIRLQGHAIELRLCAEDPAAGFLPQTGRLGPLDWPEGIRVDHGLREGLEIGSGYDSLLAKLILHAPDRDTARRGLIAALGRLGLSGLVTNRALLADLLASPVFAAGEATTTFLDREFDSPALQAAPLPETLLHLAGALIGHRAARGDPRFGFSNGPVPERLMRFETASGVQPVRLSIRRERGTLRLGPELRLLQVEPRQIRYSENGIERRLPYAFEAPDILWLGGQRLRDCTHAPAASGQSTGDGAVTAPMAGTLIALAAREGAEVAAGEVLAVIEAMKMEQPIRAPRAGRITGLAVRQGQQLAARQLLLCIEDPTSQDTPSSKAS